MSEKKDTKSNEIKTNPQTKDSNYSIISPISDTNENNLSDTKEIKNSSFATAIQSPISESMSSSTIMKLSDIELPYKYVDDDQLSKTFAFCEIPENNTLKIHFCLFSFNTSCFIEGNFKQKREDDENDYGDEDTQLTYNEIFPFLQFFANKTEEYYDFPSMEYECIVPNPTHETKGGFDQDTGEANEIKTDDNKTQDVIHFENECFKQILSMLKDNNSIHKNNISLSNLYKGFYEFQPKEIFVFVDVTSFYTEFKDEYIMCVIDEILYKRQILDTKINPLICDMFCKNRQFTKIRNLENQEYPIPLQVFLCEHKDDEYINVHKVNENPYKTMEHSMFARGYYFTGEYIGDEPILLKRFCCFIVNCLYVPDDIITEMTDEDEKQKIRERSVTASTIYFKENDIQLWAVKNILHFTEI